jgi:hypothetical protein
MIRVAPTTGVIMMSEYELLELAYTLVDTMAVSFSIYLTLLWAYLVVAYLIGDKLTFPQIVIVNSLFLIAVGVQTLGIVQWHIEASALMAAKEEISNLTQYQQTLKGTNLGAIGMPATMLLGAIAAQYFMWTVRHPKTE